MQTEFEFLLPRGYLDENGRLHKYGRMRLATALDEVETMQDPRVQANPATIPILLLSRVVVQLGEFTAYAEQRPGSDVETAVSPQIIGNLFASDLTYLQDLYLRLNSTEQIDMGAVCPHCQEQFQLQIAPLG